MTLMQQLNKHAVSSVLWILSKTWLKTYLIILLSNPLSFANGHSNVAIDNFTELGNVAIQASWN